MEPGIFAKTFDRPSLSQVLDAVVEYKFNRLQFNMACAGLPSMPGKIPVELTNLIAKEMSARKLKMDALSGTFNMIHPHKEVRDKGLRSLGVLISNAKQMGTSVITICTGSRNPKDMWCCHPENNSKQSWKQLCNTLGQALEIAESKDVILAVEPELANVVNSANKAARLLDEMKSPLLKIVFDPANLFEKEGKHEIENIIAHGVDLLGKHIVIAHAKDRKADGSFATAGHGILPYPFFIRRLKETGFDGALIAHGLKESEAQRCNFFLSKQLRKVNFQ